MAAALLAAMMPGTSVAEPACRSRVVTQYARQDFPGLTADGRSVWAGDWAAVHVWSELPYGTLLEVEGFGTVEVADTGDPYGWMPEGWVDLLVTSRREALEFGVQERQVCIARWGHGGA